MIDRAWRLTAWVFVLWTAWSIVADRVAVRFWRSVARGAAWMTWKATSRRMAARRRLKDAQVAA